MKRPINIEVQIVEVAGEELLDQLMRQYHDEHLLDDDPKAMARTREQMARELSDQCIFAYRVADITTGIEKKMNTELVPISQREAALFDVVYKVRGMIKQIWDGADAIAETGSKNILVMKP